MPLDDDITHVEGEYCECNPKITYSEGEMIIIHNSVKKDDTGRDIERV
jgi:hypothetical protein